MGIQSSNKIAIASVIFLIFAQLFYPEDISAQTQGRSVNPPVFPQCRDKVTTRGDRRHEDSGSHPVPGKENKDGRLDTYSLSDGNFVSCICNGNDGTQIDWWYINGLPLGRVDIDAYVRDGWIIEDGREFNLFEGQYLAKASDFSCTVQTQNTTGPTKTPTPTRRVSQTPTPNATTASSDNDNEDDETEELPDTGISPTVLVSFSSLAGLGWFLRKRFHLY